MTENTLQPLTEHQRFQADLPAYVNGTLSADELAWMDAYIQDYPAAQGSVNYERSVYASLQSLAESIPHEEKLARFLREMPAELSARPSPWQRLYGFLTQSPPADAPSPRQLWQQGIRIPAPAFAVLAVMVLAQAVFMAKDSIDESEIYRSSTLSSCQKMPTVKIIVKPEVRQSELVVLLRKAEANIVAGPSEIGELWLGFSGTPQAMQARALEQLRNNPLVNEAIPLPISACKP